MLDLDKLSKELDSQLEKETAKSLIKWLDEIREQSKDIDSEYLRIIDEDFWDLL